MTFIVEVSPSVATGDSSLLEGAKISLPLRGSQDKPPSKREPRKASLLEGGGRRKPDGGSGVRFHIRPVHDDNCAEMVWHNYVLRTIKNISLSHLRATAPSKREPG